MLDKNDNYTRYNTEDLNALFAMITAQSWQVSSTDYRGNERTHTLEVAKTIGEIGSVRPLYADNDKIASLPYLGVALKIRTPAGLAKMSGMGLAMIGATSDGKLPTSVVEGVIEALLQSAGQRHYDLRRRDFTAQLQDRVEQNARRCSIRVMPNIEAPTERRKPRTPAEKLDRLQSDSFYGSGGVLEGPSWAWRSGNRAPTRKWEYRIEAAQEYYERELEARMRYAEPIKELGGEPVPYETFAQYLRRLADEMEARNVQLQHLARPWWVT